MTLYDDVKAFHHIWHRPPSFPGLPDSRVWANRIRLINEEYSEVSTAYALGDLEGLADGLVDMTWVVMGTAVVSGVPFNEVWEAVYSANMAKRGGRIDASGKLLKPAGWKPPDIKSVIDEAIHKPFEPRVFCEDCGKHPATCYGSSEGLYRSFSCDSCCGHGQEDGTCVPVGP